MIDLTGKSAIVTGSGRGIGRAIAVKLAELGAAVTICDISEEIASATVSELRQRGLEADYFVLDVADADAARALIEKTAEKRGKLDILVNNAGINRDAMLHKMERKQWDEVIAVNLTGTYNTMQPASIQMREQKSGRIINISSSSWMGNIGQANYAASKAGVIGLTKTASRELAKYNVTVNAICPGFIDTDMTRGVPDKVWDLMISKIPMGRAGAPEDVANLIAFLASDTASYITGEVINIGGGMVL
ncbi:MULTISPECIES: 3-oxoacyl-ACP reductase FabG [Paenibacillus]|uniref:3-oxoacyl-[acyl-carrier-protein] reductase n=1 Tax=Paenibacillus naphthalenovorans TaxID=162209 RepID=A0A0U2U8C5_9BACL|nr:MULTISPECIES: 3-oxoacyl-ACP reductase FabG [Paenibacillus]ALS22601.1 3-ketoacyl-ACP reductase [Paenibacillus naphthalenovorans]GCL70397.1 3-oxoacyl-ACP reductase FabG [Paenibacillus naphthalenovorans]SDH83584.1 3-oxoacyl-[acyl-carrier protein] reductase/2-hydroxycyclohexanecarboxyl-CoA dehydrogenase [Paenibacillus naphthalenovorans]